MSFKKYYVQQIDERDCGVASFNMILKFYNSDYSLAHLRKLAKTDKNGTTALGIVETAKSLGFKTDLVQTV